MGQPQKCDGAGMSDPDERREFVLSTLRAASLRAKLYEIEINSVGVALKGGFIDSFTAMQWIKDLGALELITHLLPEEPEISPSTTD